MLQTSIVMLRRLRRVNGRQGAAALLVTLLWASLALAQFPAQRPQGYVNDLAGVLTPVGRQRLEALCRELNCQPGDILVWDPDEASESDDEEDGRAVAAE